MSPHVDGRTGKEGTKKRKWRSEESRLENEINQCHRTQDVDRGMALMHELIALDHSPSQQTFTVLLNLVCMHGPERWPDVRVILDCMETHQVALGEAGITALIRLHMASGDAPAALEMLQELEALSEQPVKRRAVLPVLEGVCKLGDGAVAMQLVDMLKRNDVPFQEEEFLALLTLCEHRAQEQRIGWCSARFGKLCIVSARVSAQSSRHGSQRGAGMCTQRTFLSPGFAVSAAGNCSRYTQSQSRLNGSRR